MRAFLGVVLACLTARAAAADSLIDGLRLEGWYGKVGIESGVVFGDERETAPLLGACATLVHLNRELEWIGFQGDLVADWGGARDAGARWSFGPEAGVSLYGADVGYFGERFDATTSHGMQVRAKLTVGLAAVYIRGAYAMTGIEGASADIGLQLKAPVWIKRPKKGVATAVARN